MKRLSAGTLDYLASRGWHVFSFRQIPQNDGRKLGRCPIPSDPWTVMLIDHECVFQAHAQSVGTGATLAQAVIAALPSSGGLKGALARLSAALDDLAGAYR